MNIDRLQIEEDEIIVSIDKTKYRSDNTKLLASWYPHQYNTARLLNVFDEDGYINYKFNTEGYKCLKTDDWSILSKLNCCYSLFQYENLANDGYMVNLDDDNLLLDKNRTIILIFVESIDLYTFDDVSQIAFNIQLKARILALFTKYSFQEIIDSNFTLQFKSKFELDIIECNTVNELKKIVYHYIDERQEIEDNEYVNVPRRSFRNYRILTFVFLSLFVMCAIFLGYTQKIVVANLTFGNELYGQYVREDYSNVVGISKGHELTKEQKYLVARSAVESSSLESRKKNVVLTSINMEASESLLEYWVNIGYGEYIEASSKGKTINDDEYVLYALRLEENRLINNDTMDGLEKEQALGDVRTEIKTYEEKLMEVKA